MSALNPTIPAVNQGDHSLLFRLPYELRHRIYQYVLEPVHVHIERRRDYDLTSQGIKIMQSTPSETSEAVVEDPHDEEEESRAHWRCDRLYPDHKSPEYLRILPEDGDITPKQALGRLFRIYHCRSQRPEGPSAVPPGFLDHASCSLEKEQAVFTGSTINALRQTCQWAYTEIASHAVTAEDQDDPQKRFTIGLSPDRAKLELTAHTLHFSDTRDLACFTGLVPAEVSECLHNLSVHVPTLNDAYWPYLCRVYLQPWSRRSLAPWLCDPADKVASISFYHNYTTHDLADPRWGEGREELAEALASGWVVPNIQVDSKNSSWSTKFRMSALRLRSGSLLNLRLSFPLFWRREESDTPHGDMSGSRSGDDRTEYFDTRQWLAQHRDAALPPIAEDEHDNLIYMDYEEIGPTTEGEYHIAYADDHGPGDPGIIGSMERSLCYETSNMQELIGHRMWLDSNSNPSGDAERMVFDRYWNKYKDVFNDTFGYGSQSTVSRWPRTSARLHNVHPSMVALNGSQGLEDLELDFFGDAQSVGTVREIVSPGTRVLRDGLVERFTGRVDPDDPSEVLRESVFWGIGPHPEPVFTHWADPDGNMAHLPMDNF